MENKVAVSISHSSTHPADASALTVLDHLCQGPMGVGARAGDVLDGFGRVCFMLMIDGSETPERYRIVMHKDGTWSLEADLDIGQD